MPDSRPAANHSGSGEPGISQECATVLYFFLHEMFLPQRIVNGVMVRDIISFEVDRAARTIIACGNLASNGGPLSLAIDRCELAVSGIETYQ